MFDINLVKNFKLVPVVNLFRNRPKQIGIITSGKDAKIHDMEFEKLDVAIDSTGDNLNAYRNKIR